MSGFGTKIISILLILSFFCSAHTLSLSPDDEAARDSAFQWLQLVDSGNYKDAALQTSEEVRVLQHWLTYFAAHRASLGGVKNRQIVEVKHTKSVRGAPQWRNYDVIRFMTSFERKLIAMEEVVMSKMSCCWEVSGYTIFESGKWNETREHAGAFSESQQDGHSPVSPRIQFLLEKNSNRQDLPDFHETKILLILSSSAVLAPMNSWPAKQVAAQLRLRNIRAPLSGRRTKSPEK